MSNANPSMLQAADFTFINKNAMRRDQLGLEHAELPDVRNHG